MVNAYAYQTNIINAYASVANGMPIQISALSADTYLQVDAAKEAMAELLEPITTSLGKIDATVAKIKTDVGTIKNEMKLLRTDMRDLKTSVDAIKGNVAVLESEVLSIRINTAKV